MTAAVVLLNPRAAGGRAAALREPLAQWLREQAPAAKLFVSSSIGDAQRCVQALPAASRVVVVGGDGTVHHLLAAALAGGHTLALVPLGSGNDTARAAGLFPMPWDGALTHGLSAPSVAIDTGELTAGGQRAPFISSVSAGFDASVCARVVAAPRWLHGLPRYLWGTFGELAELRRWDLRVVLDGALHHAGIALFASTCNTPTFGSGMPAVPHATVDDGRLDLLLAGPFGRGAVLRMLPRLLAGTHLRDGRVSTRPYRSLQVFSETPIPLAADGEPRPAVKSFSIEVRPKSLMFVLGLRGAALSAAAAVTSSDDSARG